MSEKRTLSQNDMFHGLCRQISKQRPSWNGVECDADAWKQLLVCGHAIATKRPVQLVKGLEGELINLRESTAKMDKERGASLIEYTMAWAANLGIDIEEFTNGN